MFGLLEDEILLSHDFEFVVFLFDGLCKGVEFFLEGQDFELCVLLIVAEVSAGRLKFGIGV